jgi:flavin-dependent dehydrogenase
VSDFDAVVVGASTAGCTAARLLALHGARVALVEKRPDPDAYKVACTHFIQSSGAPTIERLGLVPELERGGAVRTRLDFWTPHSGWLRSPHDVPHSWSVTRRTLDPTLRRLAAETPGVELMLGQTAVGVLRNGRVNGIEVEDRTRKRRALDARLVVAADGRGSPIARLARVPGRVQPNARFVYFGYYRDVRWDGRSKAWAMEPDHAYLFPNEAGLTLVGVFPHRDRLPEFRRDLEGAFRRYVDALPDAPDMSASTREGGLIGKLDMPNVYRPALDSGSGLDAALKRYARNHRLRLAPHHLMIADLASGRPANLLERTLFKAAAVDERALHYFEAVGSRRKSPLTLFRPDRLARIISGAVRG